MEFEILVLLLLQVTSFILGIFSIYFLRHKITLWIAQNTWEYCVKEVVKPENLKAIGENMENFIVTPLFNKSRGLLGGTNSGISRQLKAAENELIAAGIDQASGMSGIGDIAISYLNKYPILKAALPVLMQKMGQGSGQSGQGQSSLP